MTKDKRLSDVVRRHLLKQKEFKHKYVVPICAVDARNERIVVVREWVDGKRLEDVLRADGPLAVSRALDLALRICSALAEAHKVGLLHLQLRASNVFVVAGEEPDTESIRLVDFGIGPRRKIGTRPVYGQPGTLSPEQIEGKIVSFKSDMFSAGMLLYRMLAGHLPWTGDDETVVRQILEAPVPPIKYRVESPVPMELWAFLRQTLEKKPIHRPIGMAQMGEKLRELHGENAAGRLSVEPPEPGAAAPAAPPPAPPPKAAERLAIGKIALKPKAPPVAPAPAEAPAEPVAADAVDVDVAIVEEKPEPKVEIAAFAASAATPPPEEPPAPPPVEASKTERPAPPAPPVAAAAHAPAKPPPSPSAGPAPIAPRDLAKPKGEEIAPSSATMPMEPDIIEEATVPPPLRAPKGAASSGARPAPPSADPGIAAAAYKRGLLYGLLAGIAVAVITFFCAMFLFRGKPTPCPPAAAADQAPSADAGPSSPRLTAEGPMQVTTVGDAGTTAPAVDAGSASPSADASAAPDEAPIPSVEEDAAPPPSADAAPAPQDTARTSQDTARTPDRATPAFDAETRPPATDVAARDTDRPPAETGGTTPAADSIARANELVGQGDAALGARNFDAARAAYQEALGLQPANNRAKIGLGRAAFQQGDFEEAVRYLEPIYRNQGNMDLGVAYVRLGRLQDAKAQFEKLVERNPNNQDAVRALEAVNRQLGQ
jgi:serine/threonine-protein kinase